MEENFCYDLPDERDYIYKEVYKEEMLGSELPSKILLDNVEYQNQGLERITRNMCVYYSTAHGSNEENFNEGSDIRINGKDFGLKALDLGRLDVNKGAYISNGPRTARDLGYIKGWVKVSSLNEIKNSLYNKRPVTCGSNKIKWSTGYESPFVLSGNKGSGHAIVIIGFDDNYEGGCLIIKNSYGKNKYDNGKMYLKYTDLDLLFPSRYSLIDNPDKILTYKQKIMANIDLEKAKEAFELGLWNGERPRESMSRQEVMTVLLRVMEKYGVKKETK